jgi:hypothetical protein
MSVWHKAWAYEQHPLQVDKEGNPKPGTKNPAAKAVLVALAEFPQPGVLICWPAQETLAEMTDFEERTVRKHLAALESQGYITRTERWTKDHKRLTDRVTFQGDPRRFGPGMKLPDTDSGSEGELPERGAKATGTTFRGTVKENRKEITSTDVDVAEATDEEEEKPEKNGRTHAQRIVDEFYEATWQAVKKRIPKNEFGYHIGRAQKMLDEWEPTEEELGMLTDSFIKVMGWKGTKADAITALEEIRMSNHMEKVQKGSEQERARQKEDREAQRGSQRGPRDERRPQPALYGTRSDGTFGRLE